jgi:hypothetical protein
MGGKYTAQRWEKIADLNREMEARHSRPRSWTI